MVSEYEIDTGIKLLAFMVKNTTIGIEELMVLFENLSAVEQQNVREAFKSIGEEISIK